MNGKGFFARGVAMAALVAMPVSALAEGKAEQARKAIATAQAKIEAGNTVGVAGDAPRFQAQAVAALRLAREDLAHHDKDAAIRDATHASELADMALSASSRARLSDQQDATETAQRQAAAANARAADSQASAAAAQADAAAARAAPPPAPIVIAAPAPTPTTVTTETTQTAPARTVVMAKPAVNRRVVRRVVRHRTTHPATVTRTRTTVTTGHN